jgi:hypothetical protein
MKIAEHCQPGHRESCGYTPKCAWGDDVEIQWGDHGITIHRQEKTVTPVHAFFEAFPRNPNTFLRGEGESLEEAEKKCFAWYSKMMNCGTHEWDRRDRTDGYAYCRKCQIGATILDPLTTCYKCGVPTAWSSRKIDGKKVHVCQLHDDHYRELSKDEEKDILNMICIGKGKRFRVDDYKGYGKSPNYQIHFYLIERPIENPDPKWIIKEKFEDVEFWITHDRSKRFFRTKTKEAIERDQKRTFSDMMFGSDEE